MPLIMKIHILLFYKFVEISDTEKLSKSHLELCNSLNLKGKILLSKEGINGSVSGTKEQTEKYKKELINDERFKDIEFKEELSTHHPFEKMVIKIKPEIIRLDKEIDISKTGKHISPKEFLEVYQENKDVIILDTRNDYEFKAGKFKNAINPKIKNFREFPDFVKNFNVPKDKPIVMYCTGGIRCEKASAYMIQEGFTNVRQLHGGVINFCQQFPNTAWEGTCFVFDKRLTSRINQSSNNTFCHHCNSQCELYDNCKNKLCNELIFICPDCEKKMHSCCSNECMKLLLKG